MPIPEVVTPELDACALSMRWSLDPRLGYMLVRMSERLGFRFQIISGARSPEEQNRLRSRGRPTADNDVSTHLACPATGVDLMPLIAVTDVVKARLGAEGKFIGLRWGGGSCIDRRTGIPADWPHFDLGPRGGGPTTTRPC